MVSYTGSQFKPTVYTAQLSRYESQRCWGNDLDLFGSLVHWTRKMWFPITWSFEVNPISPMVVAIFCVKHLAMRSSVENALIPNFVF